MIIEKFKRILRTDYEQEFQNMIDRLSGSLNNTIENILQAFNKSISLNENIQCTVKIITLVVDASGNPTNPLTFLMDIPNKPTGVICINSINLTNSTSYSSNGITINYNINGRTVIINNITGLVPNNTYQLTIVAFG